MNDGPARDALEIEPSNDNPLPRAARAIFVGVAGDIKLVTRDGRTVQFTNVPGGIFPVGATKVFATGTDAEELVALF